MVSNFATKLKPLKFFHFAFSDQTGLVSRLTYLKQKEFFSSKVKTKDIEIYNFFAELGYCLPIEYYDSIKGLLSDTYSVIGQVWMLFIVTIYSGH